MALPTTDWPTLVRDHTPRLWAVAVRLVSHEADAADCVQRAFLDALRLRDVRDWSAALVRLTTARALDCLRARYRRAKRFAPLDFDPPAATTDGDLADALRHALTTLDPVPAELVALVYLEGWAVADAAAQVGVTANHAGVLLHRARASLRDTLKAFDPTPGVHRE